MTAHKHAENMMLYAQDALETETPWERWEWREFGDQSFIQCVQHPSWRDSYEFRRKPQVIRVGRHEFPKPITEAPPFWTDYFYITAVDTCFTVCSDNWAGEIHDRWRLIGNRAHLSQEAAQAHADVLNAICRGDID
ncbi:hypothetical protein A7Q01_00885 [Eikenella sp. NML96-A-049]|uniref:hypothetical protein n=1 Tax=unclassified Eikenella TaxID=2639367 RepID=UPI0007E24553|nr:MULTISPECIES: hypothetical protein [unclassified Eikenella]OAM33541.1 hypothetical protein A7P97_08160 [Eikenella sp. NML070372]OAM42474.1 hypothetical protein A7Q01_00885 [Eikenella sp. NML96-A-049]